MEVKRGDGRHCDLCGSSSPKVRCEKCSNQIFCLSCDDMYHRHPKRMNHSRKVIFYLLTQIDFKLSELIIILFISKAFDLPVSSVRPPLPPKAETSSQVPPPLPPPRNKSKKPFSTPLLSRKDFSVNSPIGLILFEIENVKILFCPFRLHG